jgi:hypothetical protein
MLGMLFSLMAVWLVVAVIMIMIGSACRRY